MKWEFENEAKRQEFWQKWEPTPGFGEKWNEYVEYQEVQLLTLVDQGT